MMIFKNRIAAGKLLADHLQDIHADLVLGIPRGGVVVAAEVAKKLKLPLDIIVTRKIGAPGQVELALGALDPDAEVVWEEELLEELGITRPPLSRGRSVELGNEIQKQWKELKRREDLYRGDRGDLKIEGKTVILIDDGMATGATVLSAARYLKRHGAKVILAIPVASREALNKVAHEVDEVVILETPEDFRAVGQFYQEFEPVEDEIVVQLLQS